MREINRFRGRIADEEFERRLIVWADITMLALELKRAVLRQKHPELGEDEINELVRVELSMLKMSHDI
jgi:hypothetical protein